MTEPIHSTHSTLPPSPPSEPVVDLTNDSGMEDEDDDGPIDLTVQVRHGGGRNLVRGVDSMAGFYLQIFFLLISSILEYPATVSVFHSLSLLIL